MEQHPDFLAKLLGVNDDKVMTQQCHFHKPDHDATDDDDDDDDKHGNDGGGFAGLTEMGEGRWMHPAMLLETQREAAQSAMKCTNVTGKAPLLIGSPSMWPSCEEGRQSGEVRGW